MGELNPNGLNKTVEAPVSKIGVGGVVQKLEGDLVPEKTKQVELSQEDQLKNLANQSEIIQRDITVLTASIEQTKIKLNEARKKFGLAPTEEDPPSVSSGNDRLEKLQAEQEAFEKQRKEIISQQERTELITKEKQKILQEKLDGLFEEFRRLNVGELESIVQGGKTQGGLNFESKSIGSLNPEMAKSLAIAFKEGVKLLSEILRDHPNLLENLDDALTEEATERIDKKIAQEKSRTEEAEPAKSALEESEHVEAQASNNLSNNFDKTKKGV